MIDRNELDLIYREHAQRIEQLNRDGHRATTTRTPTRAVRRTLALAALRACTWLDPLGVGGMASSERHTEPAGV